MDLLERCLSIFLYGFGNRRRMEVFDTRPLEEHGDDLIEDLVGRAFHSVGHDRQPGLNRRSTNGERLHASATILPPQIAAQQPNTHTLRKSQQIASPADDEGRRHPVHHDDRRLLKRLCVEALDQSIKQRSTKSSSLSCVRSDVDIFRLPASSARPLQGAARPPTRHSVFFWDSGGTLLS